MSEALRIRFRGKNLAKLILRGGISFEGPSMCSLKVLKGAAAGVLGLA
jgi:hypothetical protein